jgi:hypothetical protein
MAVLRDPFRGDDPPPDDDREPLAMRDASCSWEETLYKASLMTTRYAYVRLRSAIDKIDDAGVKQEAFDALTEMMSTIRNALQPAVEFVDRELEGHHRESMSSSFDVAKWCDRSKAMCEASVGLRRAVGVATIIGGGTP